MVSDQTPGRYTEKAIGKAGIMGRESDRESIFRAFREGAVAARSVFVVFSTE